MKSIPNKITRIILLPCVVWMLALFCSVPSVASEARCYMLKDSCAAATRSTDHRRALESATELYREADRLGNRYFTAYALYFQGVSNVILGNSAIGKSQLDKAFALADKAGDDTLRLSVYNGYGVYEANVNADYARAQQCFYKSLEYAVEIGDPMRQALVECNLAEIASIRRDITGLKYALSCYNWGVANGNDHISFAGAYHCANLYNIAGNYDMALKYIKEADSIGLRSGYAERAAVCNLYASIYAAMGHNEQALDWLREAERNSGGAQGATLSETYLAYARVLAALGRTAESERMVGRGLAMCDSLSIRSMVSPLLEQRALNLERLGDYRSALQVYKAYKQSCDSAYAERQQQSINEIRVQYDIDKREQEADMQRLMLQDERKRAAILMISLMSVCVILLVLWRHYRRQKRLYRRIVISNRESMAREQQLRDRLDELMSAAPAPDGEDERADERPAAHDDIFDRLTDIMERGAVYRDSGLTRERLAEMLGTNRTYLSQMIAAHTGKGYYQFVNSYRIKEAVKVLSDADNSDYPLKALAADLGFKSMSTFYKTFQETVGMTPSAYRDTARRL